MISLYRHSFFDLIVIIELNFYSIELRNNLKRPISLIDVLHNIGTFFKHRAGLSALINKALTCSEGIESNFYYLLLRHEDHFFFLWCLDYLGCAV